LLKLGLEVKDRTGGSSSKYVGVTTPLQAVTVADRTQPLCLDYLGSLVSDDLVKVQRNQQGLLTSVNSSVQDKTPEIFEKLAQIGENLAIAGGRSGELRSADTLDVEFDPFIWEEMIRVKGALRRFGFCVYVEGYSFSVAGLAPEGISKAGERWCSTDNPKQHDDSASYYASLPVPPEVMRTGILYRPNTSHKVVVLRRDDPGGPGGWKLFQLARVNMSNMSPILSISVERAMFAKRDTDLTFSAGVLTDVSIKKTSELAGFVRIPLAIAKAVVDVPAQIVQFKIADTQNQTALVNAQGNLINALGQLKTAQEARSGSRSVESRSGQFIGGCIDAGGPPETCNNLSRNSQ
jgi:hypothetical protein